MAFGTGALIQALALELALGLELDL